MAAKFLSTPSARRATEAYIKPLGLRLFLSTPSARRATRILARDGRATRISIHALREEGDSMSSFGLPLIALFLSTPSARRATRLGRRLLRR